MLLSLIRIDSNMFLLQDDNLSHMEDRTGGRKPDDNRVQDMEEESSDEDGEEVQAPGTHPSIQPPLPPIPDKVIVKKYDPKQG